MLCYLLLLHFVCACMRKQGERVKVFSCAPVLISRSGFHIVGLMKFPWPFASPFVVFAPCWFCVFLAVFTVQMLFVLMNVLTGWRQRWEVMNGIWLVRADDDVCVKSVLVFGNWKGTLAINNTWIFCTFCACVNLLALTKNNAEAQEYQAFIIVVQQRS